MHDAPVTTPIYLSRDEPRWSPGTENDIQDAIDQGLLEETHHLDLKREVGGTRAANKELARDLAQFAVDGGTLLVGIEEVDGAAPRPAPVATAGLSERVEQIARSAIDPPLHVATRVIPSGAEPSRGYLLIHVPASGQAPHMVDGTYFGRGDKVRIRLSDAEVRRLHTDAQVSQEALQAELRRYVDRDPVRGSQRQRAHMFAVAVPAAPRPEMLLGLLGADDEHAQLFSLLRRGSALPERLGSSFSPNLESAASFYRRPDGAALTYGLDAGRSLEGAGSPFHSEDAVEVEFTEDGTVRLMTTRLSDEIRNGQELFPTMMPILVRQLVGLAGAVAAEVAYGGMWMLGVAATEVAGLPVYTGEMGHFRTPRVSADLGTYERYTSASSSEVQQHPAAVAQRLVGRFVRGLGLERMSEIAAALS